MSDHAKSNTRVGSPNTTIRVTPTGVVPGAPWSLAPLVPNSVTSERSEQELEIDLEKLEQYQEFSAGINQVLQKYEAAMREMTVRFEILDKDLSLKRNRNPIHHIESRIKSPASIYDKLIRYGKTPTLKNLEEHLMDVAGVRVICSYVNDVKSLMGLCAVRTISKSCVSRTTSRTRNPTATAASMPSCAFRCSSWTASR